MTALGLLAATVLVARQASAAAFDGVLGIKGPGSVYAGTNASGPGMQSSVTQVTAMGGTASFGVEVINKGTDVAQFELDLVNNDNGASTPQLLSGSIDVTALAEGVHGLVTNPLAPGKSQLFTLKVATPAAAYVTDTFVNGLVLSSVGRAVRLDSAGVGVVFKSGVLGIGDFTVTSANQTAVAGFNGYYNGPSYMTAPTIKTNATATFTATIKGGSTDAGLKGFEARLGLSRTSTCATNSWVVDAKVGLADVTGALLAGTYDTGLVTPGKSVVIRITVKAVSPVPDTLGCPDTLGVLLTDQDVTSGTQDTFRSELIVNTVS